MSFSIDTTQKPDQAAAVDLSNLGVNIRNPELLEKSVGLLNGSKADSSRMFALLGAGPEIPGVSASRLGGRSYTELMVEVQKALAQMSFDTKIVNREQSVAYGKAKAETIDDGADKIRTGAWAAFAGAIAGAVVNTAFNTYALRYASRSHNTTPAHNGQQATPSSSVHVASNDGPAAGAPNNGQQATPPSNVHVASNDGPAAGAADQPRTNGSGNSPMDSGAGSAPDGEYVQPRMNIYSQFGSASSTVLSNAGDITDKNMQAQKMELDADGQLFDTYAGEQSQFYSDANQNVQRAMGLIASFVGQIYNTNTSIIASMPR